MDAVYLKSQKKKTGALQLAMQPLPVQSNHHFNTTVTFIIKVVTDCGQPLTAMPKNILTLFQICWTAVNNNNRQH